MPNPISLSLVGLLLTACPTNLSNRPGSKEYEELTSINAASNSQIIERFENYPVEKQIDIFLFSEDPRFGPILARGGEKKLEEIVTRIEDPSTHLWDKCRLVDVLIKINNDCHCIGPESKIIKRLEAVGPSNNRTAQGASDPYWKTYRDSIATLKSDS